MLLFDKQPEQVHRRADKVQTIFRSRVIRQNIPKRANQRMRKTLEGVFERQDNRRKDQRPDRRSRIRWIRRSRRGSRGIGKR